MKRHSLSAIGLILSFLVNAQTRILSPEEAIATALANNYQIRLSKNDSAVAALNYSFRNAAFLPRINGTVSGTFNNNNQKQKFSDGTERQLNDIKSNAYFVGLQLNWTLFDGLKMFATRDKAKQLVELGELNIKDQIVNTVATVITTYFDIVRQKQQLKVIDEQIGINTEQVKLAQYKLDIGTGAKPDVLQSKVDLNAQVAARLRQLTLIAQLKETLKQAMNIPVGAQTPAFDVVDSIPINMNVGLASIQANIENTSPALMMAKKSIDIARLTLKERKADLLPVFGLNAAYNFNRTNNNSTVNPFQALYSRNFGRLVGFTATIPILNNLNAKRLVRQAQLDIQYQSLVYENQHSQIDLAILNAFTDYEDQKKTLELEESNILLARENEDIVFQTYKLGAATFIQLREAQKSLVDAYNRLISARYNTKLAETELLRLKGDILH